jgi:hypothetical protein
MKKIALLFFCTISSMLRCMEQPEFDDAHHELFGLYYLDSEPQSKAFENQENSTRHNQTQKNDDPHYKKFLEDVQNAFAPKVQERQEVFSPPTLQKDSAQIIQIPTSTKAHQSDCLLCKIYTKNPQLNLHKYWYEGSSNFRCDICQLASDNERFPAQHEKTQAHQRALKLQQNELSDHTKIDKNCAIVDQKTTQENTFLKQTKKRKRTDSDEDEENESKDEDYIPEESFFDLSDSNDEYKLVIDEEDSDYNPVKKEKINNKTKKKFSKQIKRKKRKISIDSDEKETFNYQNQNFQEQKELKLSGIPCPECKESFPKNKIDLHKKWHKGKARYICKDCKLASNDKTFLRSHNESKAHLIATNQYDSKNLIPCTYKDCTETFVNEANLKSHIKLIHESQTIYICGICKYKTKRPIILDRHKKAPHIPQKCFFCPTTSGSLGEHLQHLIEKHNNKTECDLCHHKAKTPRALRQHMIRRHSEKTSRKHHPEKPKDKIIKCTIGNCIYTEYNNSITRHQQCNHGDYPCFICDMQTGSSGALKQHINEKHKDLKECLKCDRIFETPLKLREHMRRKHLKKESKK